MNNIKVLRQRKVDLRHKAEAILHAAEQAGVQLTAAQESELDAIKLQMQKTNVDCAAVEAEMDRERNNFSDVAACDRGKFGKAPPSGPLYAEMWPEVRDNGGFQSSDEFYKVAASGLYDSRLYAGSMNESTPAEGGFMVPTQFSADLLDASLENEIVRPRATIFPMTTATRKIAGWDGLDNSGGAIAGFTSQWLAELQTATPTTGKTKLLQLTSQKLALFTSASNELVADGLGFEAQLGQKMIQACGWSLDVAFLTGSGAGKPLGVLNAPSTISVAKESSQSSATIITDNVVKMFARLHPGCMSNAVWVANNTTIPMLLQLVLGSGTAVSRLLERGPDGEWTMLTRPVIFSEKVPVLGTPGDLMLVDFTQYAIGMRKEVTLDKSQHVGWTEDSSAFRTIIRVDGQPVWEKAFKPRNGDTLSWAVTLAVRP